MEDDSRSSPESRWGEFKSRPYQNYAVTLLAINSCAVTGLGVSNPDWVESMHVFSLAFAAQLLLAVGYFFSKLYQARWYRNLTVVCTVFAGLIAGMGWIVLLILEVGIP